MSKPVVRVGAYTRCSTIMQVKEDGSLDMQQQLIRRFIEQKNATSAEEWALHEVYEEAGISGKNVEDRPQLQRLLRDVHAGHVTCLVVTKFDRVSRNVADFVDLSRSLRKVGCSLVSIGENFDSSTPAGELLQLMAVGFAQFERETIRARVTAAVRERAQRGLFNGGRILGYEYRDGGLVPVEEERVVVQAIFEKYRELQSLRKVAAAVNAAGMRTKRYLSRRGIVHGGTEFTKNGVYWVLQNPIYAGGIRQHGRVYEGRHEAIIDPELFDEVQRLLEHNGIHPKRRRDKPKFTFMLDGLVRCGCCSASMSPSWSIGRSNTYRYYVCLTDRDNGGCDISRVNADELEGVVADRLRTLAEDERLLEAVITKHNSADEAQVQAHEYKLRAALKARAEADSQLKNLVDFLAEGGDSSAVKKRLRDLELLRDQLDSQVQAERTALKELQHHTVTASGAKHGLDVFNKAYEAATPEQRRELAHLLVDEITFCRGENEDHIKMALYEVEPSTGPDLVAAANQPGSNDGKAWWIGRDSNPEPTA